jgi:hypothetical protein
VSTDAYAEHRQANKERFGLQLNIAQQQAAWLLPLLPPGLRIAGGAVHTSAMWARSVWMALKPIAALFVAAGPGMSVRCGGNEDRRLWS